MPTPIPPGIDPNATVQLPSWALLLAGYAIAHLFGFLFRLIDKLLNRRNGTKELEDVRASVRRVHGRLDELIGMLLKSKE